MATDKFDFGPEETRGQEPFYPPSVDFEEAVIQVLKNKLHSDVFDVVFDIIWKKTFHYLTFFESLDGFAVSDGVSLDEARVAIATDGVSGNADNISKRPVRQGLMTYSQPSRMRTAIMVNQITAQTIYLTVGSVATGSQGYGFKIVDDTLYGVTDDGTTESTIKLQTISVSTNYNLEARYSPSNLENKVIFFVDAVEKGILATNLPSPSGVVNDQLFYFRITANAAAVKTMWLSFFEYLQRRNILQ